MSFCMHTNMRSGKSTRQASLLLAFVGSLAWPLVHLIVGNPVPTFGGEFKAGSCAIDISPRVLPAIQNGGFLERTSDRIDDPLYARCLVMSDGDTTIGIAIVDSCMIPRDVCDAIKRQVEHDCGIPANRILIAATHTHSAPSMMDYCLGSRKDVAYTEFAIPRIASGIVRAHGLMEPAKAGLGRCRRATPHPLPPLDPSTGRV